VSNHHAIEQPAKEELAHLNRVYNLFVWGCIFAAWFTIAVTAFEIASERGWI
jgi:hypothetical protein